MNTKIRLFKHTFIVLSIMCFIMLGSKSIIYGLSVKSDFSPDTGSAVTTTSEESDKVQSAPTQTGSSDTSAGKGPSQSSAAQEGTTQTPVAEKSIANSTSAQNSEVHSVDVQKASEQPSEPTKSSVSADGNTDTPPSKDKPKNTDNEDKPGTSTSTPSDNGSVTTPTHKDNDLEDPANQNPIRITISAVGDIMAHQGNLNNAYSPKTGKYDFTGPFEYVKPFLSKSDLTIGNFETVTAGPKTGYTSYPSFNTPDSILEALSWTGFDILSTANNHSLDRGLNGLTRTIQMITKNKMVNVGSSTNGKNKYIIKNVNGIKVGILAYSGLYNGVDGRLNASQKGTYLSPINELQIQKDIKAVKAAKADAIIVVVHWGTEYQREPNSSQTTLAKKMVNWGADIILGSHPHVIQKSEIVKVNGKDKFIIYSMGNFISGYRRVDKAKRPNKIFTEDGVIVNLQLEKDPKKGIIIKDVSYIPTWVDKYYVNYRPVFKIIPIPSPTTTGKYITDRNRTYIKQSYKNTMGIMAQIK